MSKIFTTLTKLGGSPEANLPESGSLESNGPRFVQWIFVLPGSCNLCSVGRTNWSLLSAMFAKCYWFRTFIRAGFNYDEWNWLAVDDVRNLSVNPDSLYLLAKAMIIVAGLCLPRLRFDLRLASDFSTNFQKSETYCLIVNIYSIYGI